MPKQITENNTTNSCRTKLTATSFCFRWLNVSHTFPPWPKSMTRTNSRIEQLRNPVVFGNRATSRQTEEHWRMAQWNADGLENIIILILEKYMVQKSPTTTWYVRNSANNGIDYQPQLVDEGFSEPSTVWMVVRFVWDKNMCARKCDVSQRFIILQVKFLQGVGAWNGRKS